jgi:hypothetical protein
VIGDVLFGMLPNKVQAVIVIGTILVVGALVLWALYG